MNYLITDNYVKVYGNASVAQKVLSRGDDGTFLSINFSWGMAVTMGVYWAGSISGTTIRKVYSY